MIRVSYVNPMGYVTSRVKYSENGETKMKKVKYDLCFANLKLFAEIEHTKTQHILQGFFVDNAHLKRIYKGEGERAHLYLVGYHYHFNSFYRVVNNTTIEWLNRLGAEVSFYYENPNEKRNKKKIN